MGQEVEENWKKKKKEDKDEYGQTVKKERKKKSPNGMMKRIKDHIFFVEKFDYFLMIGNDVEDTKTLENGGWRHGFVKCWLLGLL